MHSKLAILFVIDALTFGGGERVFSQIINSISRKNYHIILASQRNEDFYSSIDSKRVTILPLNFRNRINFRLLYDIVRIINDYHIHIIHGQGSRAEFYARMAKKLSGKSKYVSTIAMPVEGFNVHPHTKQLYRLLDNFSDKYVDRFIVVSEALKDLLLKKRKIQPSKVIRIHNGIELDHYNPVSDAITIRQKLKLPKDAFLIGAVGRLVWQKGFEYLIEAMSVVIPKVPNAKVLIIGDGPLKSRLTDLSISLGVNEHVIFTGFQNQIQDFLAALDVLAAPSLLEGLPMVILEAMGMSKAVLASNIDGINEQIIHGYSGILVPARSSQALAHSIINLAMNDHLRSDLGRHARKIVEDHFSVTRMISETEKIYQSLSTSRG